MRTRDMILAPIFLLVVTVFLMAGREPEAAAAAGASGGTAQLVGGDREEHYVGVVVDWRLEKDGTVFLLLEGRERVQARETGRRTREAGGTRDESEGEIERRWFKTPPIQGQQVHFQDLVLFTIMHMQLDDSDMRRLTIWGERRPTARGDTRDNAITIDTIGPG